MRYFTNDARITAPKPITKPTDRSIPPEMITNVCPRPRISGADANIKML
jgi:hypothetical protein